jgi:hypothetical protein
MEQEVGYSQGGCKSRPALKGSGEMTSMVPIYIEDGYAALRCRMWSSAPEWMDSLSGAPEWMDPQC